VVKLPKAVLVALLVGALAIVTGIPARAQSGKEAPKATEIGVTSGEIHVAAMADVDNPFAPGLFQGAVDGMKGAAAYINSKAGGGGIAGRKLVVDFIDSHLNPNESRNGVIKACSQDFALVGTAALFLTNVDDEIGCKDQAGAATGLPDIGAIVTGVPETCSPVSFPALGSQLDCATKDQHPQSYRGNQGDYKYLLKTHKNDLHGSMVVSNDTKDANRGGQVLTLTAVNAGIKADQNVTRSGRDPQSAYTSIVNKLKSDGSNFSYDALAVNSEIELRSEAQLQGLNDPNFVWECTEACYGKQAKQNATVMEGEYVSLAYLPFEEASSNPTLKNFVKYVGKDKIDGFAVSGWVAGLEFAQAVKAAVAKHGVNGLTRSALLEGLKTVAKFDAGGMIGGVPVASRGLSPCFVLTQLKSGKFVRVYPKKKGTFDCKPSNLVTIKADLIGT